MQRTLVRETRTPVDRLRAELTALFNQPEFFTATWGVVIQSMHTGEVLYAQNADKGFMPASNLKLYTTALALSRLGPDFVFHTRIYRHGPLEADGTLNGDLVLAGSGDPVLGGRYNGGRILADFEAWADSLHRRGLRRIAGRIIGDDNLFDDEIMGQGWAWDYQSDWYAAQISGLSFNDNCIDILFTAGDTLGAPARFRLEPETDFARIDNRVTTVADAQATGVRFWRNRATNDVRLTGTIGLSTREHRDWFSVENPTLFAAYIFRQTLLRRGIQVEGAAVDIDSLSGVVFAPADSLLLLDHISPPLSQICETVNKVSQNLYAELLLRAVGLAQFGRGNFENGAAAMRSFLASIGINPETMGIADGSGLSRLNLVSPRQTVTVLRYMRNHPSLGEIYYNTLPIAGVDGTLSQRMRDSAAANNVRAKTGYIGRARSLSGYVLTADGEELAFSMMANNYTVPTSLVNQVQDLVCERLANFSRQPQ